MYHVLGAVCVCAWGRERERERGEIVEQVIELELVTYRHRRLVVSQYCTYAARCT